MADLLSTAVSALAAFQRGLDTTGHNIANSATEGYSRQRVEYATREAQPYGNGWLGSGVNATTVVRAYDQFLALQYRSSSTALGRQEVYASYAERVNGLFAATDTGISAALQRFANAVQDVATAPTSIPARQALLAEAVALAGEVGSQAERLDQLAAEVRGRLEASARDISGLASGIADLNERIVTATARTGQPPNDLLDQRDRLIDELSGQVAITTVRQDDGAVNVFIGNGQALVLGASAATVATQADEYDAASLRLGIQSTAGFVDISAGLSGGEIGGLLDFQAQMLDPTRRALGQLAVGIATTVNAQQHLGMDLNGAAGADMFAVGDVAVLPSSRNSGGTTVSAVRADAGALTAADYVLESTGSGWTLRRADTGATVALAGSGSAADPFRAEGLEIVVSGAAVAGDRYLVRPTMAAARGMQALLTSPAGFAAALPVAAAAAATNGGAATVAALSVTDPSDPLLRSTATITFTSAGTYSIDGGPDVAYTPGTAIDHHGWRLELAGTPAAGDTFTVAANSAGIGDNRNALALVEAFAQPTMNGGTAALADLVDRVVAEVGVQTRQAQVSRDALDLVRADARAAVDSVSGVNLDEEAANLVRLQQAYQAAAQVVQVADTLFQTLIAAVRR